MLSHRLRQIREKQGISQRELGRVSGLGVNQINRYENGTSTPTIETLKAIASQLNISTDYLLGLSDDPKNDLPSIQIKPDERELLDTYRNEGWPGVIRLGGERLSK